MTPTTLQISLRSTPKEGICGIVVESNKLSVNYRFNEEEKKDIVNFLEAVKTGDKPEAAFLTDIADIYCDTGKSSPRRSIKLFTPTTKLTTKLPTKPTG